MVKKNIKNTIKKHNLINADEHIVIGLSGGPDSVCLFSVLNDLKQELQIHLHAVHVNHGFRPGAADEDQQYVEQLCREKGVECTSFIYDCNAMAREEGLTGEEAGRKARYTSFLKVADRLIDQGIPAGKIKIAVAQNADDQAETVLFRLMRGTGTDGLAGMSYSRMEKNISVIRPLLDTWRRDIESYCETQGLMPRTDHTNLEPVYTRNKIRLQLIPYLEEHFNNNIMETLGRLSRIAAEDKAYMWECADKAYEELEVSPGKLDQNKLADLNPAVRHRVIMKALQIQGLEQDVTYSHLEAADSILDAAGESKTVEFPDGYRMSVRYGEAAFYRVNDDSDVISVKSADRTMQTGADRACDKKANLYVTICQLTELSSKENMQSSTDSESVRQAAAFDYDKITAVHGGIQPVLRTRCPGDYITIKGGRKKIQDLFVDMKIPKEYRDGVLVVAAGSEVLWLPAQESNGVKRARYSYQCKLDMNTKKCLVLELDCEI